LILNFKIKKIDIQVYDTTKQQQKPMNWKCKAMNIPQHKDISNTTRVKNVG